MQIEKYKEFAEQVKSNDTYKIFDFKGLLNLNLSLTELQPHKKTGGHYHTDADEIYFFISGEGLIRINGELMSCKKDDVFIIPRGSFHQVQNTSPEELKFWCVFEKYGDRK